MSLVKEKVKDNGATPYRVSVNNIKRNAGYKKGKNLIDKI
jgi:hypothetical protein